MTISKIAKHKIPKNNFVLAIKNQHNVWEECKDDDKNAELLLCKEWVETQVGINNDKVGILAPHVERCMKKCAVPLSCVYLFSLGTVQKMRNNFSIPVEVCDDSHVCKYGMTKNLESRVYEHMSDYGKLENVNLRLATFAPIDPTFLSEAEGELRNFFNLLDMKLHTIGRNELVVVSEKQLKVVENQYRLIAHSYSSKVDELLTRVSTLENELRYKTLELDKAIEIMSLQARIHELELKVSKNIALQ